MEAGKGLELPRDLESNMWTQEEVVTVRWKPRNRRDASMRLFSSSVLETASCVFIYLKCMRLKFGLVAHCH